MVIWWIWENGRWSFVAKVVETAFELFKHWLGGWILAISFVILFALMSVPLIYQFGEHSFGHTLKETLNYISKNGWEGWGIFWHFNWYYKIAICLGWFFPIMHLITGYEDDRSLD